MRMNVRALPLLALITLSLMACNLSSVPPTPTSAPFPTTDPALFAPPLPGSGGLPVTPINNGALTSSDPNCPQPMGWLLYTVEPGDTLSLLSMQTDTPVVDLATANCITDSDSLYVGQVIYVPTVPIISP